jgi:hypothetical protein
MKAEQLGSILAALMAELKAVLKADLMDVAMVAMRVAL